VPFEEHIVAVLIPAFNEGTQIRKVIESVPDFVDHVVVVDDASTDDTVAVVRESAVLDPRITLLTLKTNRGVGGALSEAYIWAREHDIDIAVSVDGDGQMDPAEMADLLDPIVARQADYTKGNRLWNPEGWRRIPRVRLLGNAVLSLLTKMASGYWAVIDSQSGYSAANRFALDRIDWGAMYARYGRPNDVLVLANVADCRVADVPVTPIYGVGERSSMKVAKVIFTISMLLVRRFWWRLGHKYLLRDFHPLLFFYALATITSLVAVGLGTRLIVSWISNGHIPQVTALALAFFAITSLNSLFFAYWMDMQANAHLMVKLPGKAPSRSRGLLGDIDEIADVV
jgi:glycosyltransferase involved in cell wall biosynthesis